MVKRLARQAEVDECERVSPHIFRDLIGSLVRFVTPGSYVSFASYGKRVVPRFSQTARAGMASSFEEWFRQALGTTPYPYQTRLATGDALPEVLTVPTGAGKTAAALLAWLWRRRFHRDPEIRDATPRRLVYCLPMRVLVEQTAKRARHFLTRLDLQADRTEGEAEAGIGVHLLMGGEVESDWVRSPHREAVLVGTQDMLLSRALNRGYAASRFRWPMEFGLLHSDALWVFDEPQIMGPGRATSVQLEAFRRKLSSWGPTGSLWMSATLREEDLETADFDGPTEVEKLTEEDRGESSLRQRLEAAKNLYAAGLEVPTRKRELKRDYFASLADTVLEAHRDGTRTLVVLNTVGRVQGLHDELLDRGCSPVPPRGEIASGEESPSVLLVHSRFRGWERKALNERLEKDEVGEAGRIVVATQVVEAGVDFSSRTLFTELAPWSSLVQRFGRCNRYGEHEEASLYWIDVPEKKAPPYEPDRLERARETVEEYSHESVSPDQLKVVPQPRSRPVLRRRDLLDFFDTEPDLSGNDTDPSRFIRQTDDRNVSVFWGEFERAGEAPDVGRPERHELCDAPIYQVRDLLNDGRQAWCWDYLEEQWSRARGRDLRPGQVLLLRSAEGGYTPLRGWTPGSEEAVTPVPGVGRASDPESMDEDTTSETGTWISLVDHTDRVVEELEGLISALTSVRIPKTGRQALRSAARWHDLGKAHPVFQSALAGEDPARRGSDTVWAKAPKLNRYRRPYFRHELASALALAERPDLVEDEEDDLVAYLVAAHHGKVRLTIRALPGEEVPEGDGRSDEDRFARGIWEEDELPSVDLGGGCRSPALKLSLACMELGAGSGGAPSWLERTLQLRDRDDLGPFRLAYLEALLRVADWRASEREDEVSADE